MTAARLLTTRVMQNSRKPAVSRAESCAGVASLKEDAISEEIVDVPD